MTEPGERPFTWKLALWPVLVFVYVSAMVFALAKAHPFSPSTPASSTAPVTLGDAYGGELVFQEACASCHGDGGSGGGIGPALAGRGLDIAAVKAQIEGGSGAMPANLVDGQRLADVLAYIAQISSQ
jgi:mono/diheme cytochrome c family protein